MFRIVESWGVASFDNDPAADWFLIVEEAPELRFLWEEGGDSDRWLADVDHLLERLRRSDAGGPPSVSP